MDNDFKHTEEYLNAQLSIDTKKKEILPIDEKISTANKQLNSISFKALTMLGLGPDDFRSDTIDLDTVLPGLANTNLSYKDLERKVQLLYAQKLQLLEEINGLIAVLRQLELNEQIRLENKRKEDMQLIKKNFIFKYESNPREYIASAIVVETVPSSTNKQNIYAAADQLIAIADKINLDLSKSQIKKAWQVVSLARDISSKDNTDKLSSMYAYGTEQFFNALIKSLPEEFRGIEVLYKAGQYEKVDKYLDKILFSETNVTDDVKQKLQQDVDEQRQIKNKLDLDLMARRGKSRIYQSKQRSL